MKKLLLIVPPLTCGGRADYPPLGCFYLSSYVNQTTGAKVRIIDYNIETFSLESLKKSIERFIPDFIGISVTTAVSELGFSMARYVKSEFQSIPLLMGGPHASMMPDECLEVSDIVVRGEGEITLSEIVEGKELSLIKGISYKSDGTIFHNPKREFIADLDSLPLPKYNVDDLKKYVSFPQMGIMSSRGCPYGCTFCYSPYMWERRLRVRSPNKIVDEIEYLRDQYGAKGIFFFDDTLNIPPKRGIQICNEIIRRKLNEDMFFDCQLRVNRQFINPELFSKLKKANFRKIFFGIESGSQSVLEALNKSITLAEARAAVRMSRYYGLETSGFFMIGNWDEGLFDVLKTWKFIIETGIRPGFSVSTPFPKTVYYDITEKNGLLPANIDWAMATTGVPIVRTNKMTKAQISLVFKYSNFLAYLLKRNLKLRD